MMMMTGACDRMEWDENWDNPGQKGKRRWGGKMTNGLWWTHIEGEWKGGDFPQNDAAVAVLIFESS